MQKIFVIGLETLPEDRREALKKALTERQVEISELDQALAAIYVNGSDKNGKLRQRAKQKGLRFFQMSQEDDYSHGSSLRTICGGEAVRIEDAARMAWSIINTPEEWCVIGAEKEEKNGKSL